ncbi:MAG TPA: selenide, water dikinase SelD [Bacteroidales bacterium]|nr:selenide, water dikinase SelD [Bacteroidales bacterium]
MTSNAKKFDLLSTVEEGGCSAKLPAAELSKALQGLPSSQHPNLLVKIETHDDAGVYKINDELALIQTTDFFPPVCSDAYEFGQIAAANALSDIFAMGGKVLTALNIVAFPANIPLEILSEMLRGGMKKVEEAGGVIAGGHTIVDSTPKYGLAVTGSVHPERIITNSAAQAGDILVLTKPVGAGIIMAGKRIGQTDEQDYLAVIESMKQLNARAAEIMQKFGIRCSTDITGFGLAGHALKLAKASGVTLNIHADAVPYFDGAKNLAELGCLPGACFRNLEYAEKDTSFADALNYENKMLLMDAQTSGGLLICCPETEASELVIQLRNEGYINTTSIGNITSKRDSSLIID